MKAKPPEEKGDAVNAYGTHELCAWKVRPSQFWFQTTRSDLARKLAKRSDTQRVEVSGLNHYRQTFEIRGTRRKVERIIRRYLASAGDQFSVSAAGQHCAKPRARVKTAGGVTGGPP
jgi:hypothetical protein